MILVALICCHYGSISLRLSLPSSISLQGSIAPKINLLEECDPCWMIENWVSVMTTQCSFMTNSTGTCNVIIAGLFVHIFIRKMRGFELIMSGLWVHRSNLNRIAVIGRKCYMLKSCVGWQMPGCYKFMFVAASISSSLCRKLCSALCDILWHVTYR